MVDCRTDDDLAPLRDPRFSEPLKKLEELMSQSNRSFLLGAGCSKCAGLPLMEELTNEVQKKLVEGSKPKQILNYVAQSFAGAKTANVEDYMSEIVDLLAIAERRVNRGAKNSDIRIDKDVFQVDELRQALHDIKNIIAALIDTSVDIAAHRKFIKAVHGTLRAGKSTSSKPVDYIILNYDNLIEDALAIERLPYTDGFSGGVTGWWDSSLLASNEVIARVLKVHGSIDWCLLDDDTLPRRIRPSMSLIQPIEKVLIWPAATKYIETQRDPYAQIMNYLRGSLRPTAHAQIVLIICGYGFGDAHINIEIDRALHEADGNLTVLVFTSLDQPDGQLASWLANPVVREEVRIHTKRGFYHGQIALRSDVDLPWWKFETLTRLLGGER